MNNTISNKNHLIKRTVYSVFLLFFAGHCLFSNASIANTKNKDVTNIPQQNQSKKKLTGLVTDTDGNPMIGASVSIVRKGVTTGGVVTDIDGKYSIEVLPGDQLVFAFIGCNKEERQFKNETTLNVRLMEQSVGLEDIVVVGYAQQKKSSIVASVNTITSKELSSPTRNLTNNIAGQISGVLAVQRSGEPGKDDSQFWIRGISSFAGGTSPLVLVDGVPRRMNDIDVDEIETFTVLKDAAATSVYGAEGANGVVLITSKRGSIQKATIDIRAEYGVVSSTRLPKMLRSYDYASIYNEAKWEEGGNPTIPVKHFSDEALEMYLTGADPDLYPDADFAGLLKDQTTNQRVTINLRGGSDRARYFVSGSFYNEDGIFDSKAIDKYDANIGLSRYNIRSNIDIDVTKTTLLSVDISGQYLDKSNPGEDADAIFSSIYTTAPNLFPLRFSDGTFSEHPDFNGGSFANPYNMLNESGYQKEWNANIQSKMTLKQKLDFITNGLSVRLTGSFDSDFKSVTKRSKQPKSYYMILNEKGEKEYVLKNEGKPSLSDPTDAGRSGNKQIYLEASVNYERIFAEKHDVTGMLLYMQKEKVAMGSGLPFKKQSMVGRFTYGYDNRYLMEGSFGLTGSENFAKGYRYGVFPAVGVAWYVSNEAFMQSTVDVINKLKFRFSYGKTGNDNIGGSRFPYRGTLNEGAPGYNFGFAVGAGGKNPIGGISESTFESPFLSWEIENKMNVGIDMGLLRGKIDLSFDIFNNDRSSILMKRNTISQITGFRNAPFQNFGKVNNKGFDGNINIKQSIGRKLNLSFRGNVTFARNKVTEKDEVDPAYEYQRATGHALNVPLLYIAEGLFANTDFNITEKPDGSKSYQLKEGIPTQSGSMSPGDIKYKDLNEDGVIDSYDATYNHKYFSETPELVYGFGLNIEYQGFYANIFFQGVGNASMSINGGGRMVPFSGKNGGVNTPARTASLDHWSSRNPDNQNVLIPRLHVSDFPNNTLASTWWYRSGDFIRLKNVEFGYVFPKQLLSKTPVKRSRIYVQGNNLAIWDDIKMWDPELGSSGGGTKYPINRTWTLGLEIVF